MGNATGSDQDHQGLDVGDDEHEDMSKKMPRRRPETIDDGQTWRAWCVAPSRGGLRSKLEQGHPEAEVNDPVGPLPPRRRDRKPAVGPRLQHAGARGWPARKATDMDATVSITVQVAPQIADPAIC